NTSSTRIELLWGFQDSASLTDAEKSRIKARLGGRLDADGLLRVVAGNRRSQLQNRAAAEDRLAELVRSALHIPTRRKRTKPTKSSKEARLSDKKRRSTIKGSRRHRSDYDCAGVTRSAATGVRLLSRYLAI